MIKPPGFFWGSFLSQLVFVIEEPVTAVVEQVGNSKGLRVEVQKVSLYNIMRLKIHFPLPHVSFC